MTFALLTTHPLGLLTLLATLWALSSPRSAILSDKIQFSKHCHLFLQLSLPPLSPYPSIFLSSHTAEPWWEKFQFPVDWCQGLQFQPLNIWILSLLHQRSCSFNVNVTRDFSVATLEGRFGPYLFSPLPCIDHFLILEILFFCDYQDTSHPSFSSISFDALSSSFSLIPFSLSTPYILLFPGVCPGFISFTLLILLGLSHSYLMFQ